MITDAGGLDGGASMTMSRMSFDGTLIRKNERSDQLVSGHGNIRYNSALICSYLMCVLERAQ